MTNYTIGATLENKKNHKTATITTILDNGNITILEDGNSRTITKKTLSNYYRVTATTTPDTNKEDTPKDQKPAPTKEETKKETKQKAPKNPDLQCIAEVIRVLDNLKVAHKESWEGKGTAPVIDNKRPFEFWKRNGRVRINYSPACVTMPKELCVSVDENLRPDNGLCGTAYVAFTNIEAVVTKLVNSIKHDAVKMLGKRKKAEAPAADTKKNNKKKQGEA